MISTATFLHLPDDQHSAIRMVLRFALSFSKASTVLPARGLPDFLATAGLASEPMRRRDVVTSL